MLPRVLQESAVSVQAMKIAIIGGGIIGVTTAVVLAEKGHEVTIFSRDAPENTTSHAAGAVIYPVNVEDSERCLRWFHQNNQELEKLRKSIGAGIEWIDWMKCSAEENCPVPLWLSVIENARLLKPEECPYGNRSGIYARLLYVDVDAYYPYMRERLAKAGGAFRIQAVSDFDELPDEFEILINCTGVFASQLVNDTDLHPARGQIVLVRNPGITRYYSSFDSKNYMYPRGRERCVLGGSYDVGAWDMTPDPQLTAEILEWAKSVEPSFEKSEILDVRVGLRPVRSTIRLEQDVTEGGRKLIHNYGHGGCGYTLAWGCAADILKILD